eukprot:gene1405-2006_t
MLDKDGDGKLTAAEIKEFDVDGDGKLSAKEIQLASDTLDRKLNVKKEAEQLRDQAKQMELRMKQQLEKEASSVEFKVDPTAINMVKLPNLAGQPVDELNAEYVTWEVTLQQLAQELAEEREARRQGEDMLAKVTRAYSDLRNRLPEEGGHADRGQELGKMRAQLAARNVTHLHLAEEVSSLEREVAVQSAPEWMQRSRGGAAMARGWSARPDQVAQVDWSDDAKVATELRGALDVIQDLTESLESALQTKEANLFYQQELANKEAELAAREARLARIMQPGGASESSADTMGTKKYASPQMFFVTEQDEGVMDLLLPSII